MVPIPEDLREAIKILDVQNVGDYVYDIKERELKGWYGPLVTDWNTASNTIKKYAKMMRDEGI